MGVRVQQPIQIINAAGMTGNFTSDEFTAENIQNLAVFLYWTGSPVGEFFLEASPDSGSNWSRLVLPQTATTSGKTSHLINVPNIGFTLCRVAFTFTSGTGAGFGYWGGKSYT